MANVLTKEAGGQPVWAWGAELVGAFIVYRWWKGRQAASAASAAAGTTAGYPALLTSSGSVGAGGQSSSTPAPSNWAGWLSQALAGATGPGYSASQAFNDFTSWINGGYVSQQGYNAIGNAISTLGLPPGFGSGVPPIQLAPSTPAPASAAGSAAGVATGGGNVPAGWLHIPDPHIGSLIASVLGAQYQTVGNGQYYNPGQVVAIAHPQQGQNLLNMGYNVVGFNGTEYYNPQQTPTPGRAVYKT